MDLCAFYGFFVMMFVRKGFRHPFLLSGGISFAGVPEWSKGQGLGPCDVGLRAFESLPLHSISLVLGGYG